MAPLWGAKTGGEDADASYGDTEEAEEAEANIRHSSAVASLPRVAAGGADAQSGGAVGADGGGSGDSRECALDALTALALVAAGAIGALLLLCCGCAVHKRRSGDRLATRRQMS